MNDTPRTLSLLRPSRTTVSIIVATWLALLLQSSTTRAWTTTTANNRFKSRTCPNQQHLSLFGIGIRPQIPVSLLGLPEKSSTQVLFPMTTTRKTTRLSAKKKKAIDDDDDDEGGEIDWDEEEEDDGDYVEDDDDDEEYDEEDEEEWDEDDEDEDEDNVDIEDDDIIDVDDDEILDESDLLAAQSLAAENGILIEEEDDEEADDDDDDDDDEDDDEFDYAAYSMQTNAASSMGDPSDWDDEDEDGVEYPLEDDPDDPNYQKQKEIIEANVAESIKVERDRNFDALDFLLNEVTPEEMPALDEFMRERFPQVKDAEEMGKNLMLTEGDIKDLDLEMEITEVTDLMDDDPYPRHEEGEVNYLEQTSGVTDDDMEELDKAWKTMRADLAETPWNQVMLNGFQDPNAVPNETIAELNATMAAYGEESPYNFTRWLLYDLDFNVTNLILAAAKHNPKAPIFFEHWFPQISTMSRYKSAQERDFDFTWDDVSNADVSELERYYKGMGYDEIPEKAPSETGLIEFEYLDEEEIKMAAFETWYKDVYNSEWDRKDLDDEDIVDEDNVFSEYYKHPQHPDFPKFGKSQAEVQRWIEHMGTDEELGDDEVAKAYRDFVAQDIEYTVVKDDEFEKEFRGHLIVACTGEDPDLEIAEKITLAMEKAHGKKVFVETQVHAHARLEDNVFEVWLESYEIELLHSKKRATSNTQNWEGPAECDDKQVNYLVDRVGFLISDDARYSYSLDVDVPV